MTKTSILARVARKPKFTVVPEHAQRMFDKIIGETEADAIKEHPGDVWGQIEFWKEKILARVAPTLRGIVAVYFHEYMACLLRNEESDDDDPYGFSGRPYNPQAEVIAQRDAYLASVASLA